MPENDNFYHCAGTKKVAVSHGNERLKKIARLEATSENRHRRCGRDMLGQTVPSIYGQQQQGKPDHRRWTAVCDGHSATVRKRNEGMQSS